MARSPARVGTHLVTAVGLALLAACSAAAPAVTPAPTPEATPTPAPAAATTPMPAAASTTAPAALMPIRPAALPERPTVVAFVTDFGNCDEGETAVADMVQAWRPAAIVTGGDNTQGLENCRPYTQSVVPYYGDYLAAADPPLFLPALGNHDYTNPGAGLAAYAATFPHVPTDEDARGRWYDQPIGHVTFFVLDSDAPLDALAAQQRWLRDDLAEAIAADPDGWRVVVFHRPAHTSGEHPPFEPMHESAGWDFAGWGADLVLNGHQHIYEDVVVDGLHRVTGPTGALGTVRECPPELVEGSRLCIDGPGALRLTATAQTLHVDLHLAESPHTVADRVTLHR